MDVVFIVKIAASLTSALAAWWGFKKFKAVVDAYRELSGHRAAEPFTSFSYRWSKELQNPKNQELILHIGNRERRPLIVKEIIWNAPALRVKWAAESKPDSHNLRIPEGEGAELEFDPSAALDPILHSKYFATSMKKISIITSLRLVIALQTGERVALRAPSYFRSYLANNSSLGKFGQVAVYLHHRIWP